MASPADQPSSQGRGTTTRSGAGDIARPLGAWCGLALVLGARAYRAMLLTLVMAALVPSLWSWSTYVVRSGSMEPRISVGDVVITKPFSEASPVPVGRVMLFTPSDAAHGQQNRLHRVIENLGDGTYVTAGDANRNNDTSPVRAADFHGRAIICVPFVGLPLVWLRDGNLALLIGWILVTVTAFYFSSRPSCRARHRRPSPGNPPVSDDETGPRRPSHAVLRASHPGSATVAATVAVVATALSIQSAEAAFSDTTVDALNTWKVAVNSSRASSTIQVYDTPSPGGWFQRGSVSVNISATASRGATVRSISYRLNGGAWVTTKSSSLVFTLSTQGDNTVTYFATDSAGAAETMRAAHVKLDNQAPALAVTSPTGDLTHAQWRAACAGGGRTGGVCGTITDPLGSGVQRVEYVLFRSADSRCFNGTGWTSAACSTRTTATLGSGTWLAAVPDAALAGGRTWYTITVYSQDNAGNTINVTRNFSVG